MIINIKQKVRYVLQQIHTGTHDLKEYLYKYNKYEVK